MFYPENCTAYRASILDIQLRVSLFSTISVQNISHSDIHTTEMCTEAHVDLHINKAVITTV
jgi:hypothetical protein